MSQDETPPRKTPQEKKALSLRKDRRNTYGNNDKAARKIIPLRKAKEIRRNRHKNNQALAGIENLEEAAANLVESSALQDVHRVRGWRKSPDDPLGEVLESKAANRARRVGGKVFARATRATSKT